jgi:hypothetical protein
VCRHLAQIGLNSRSVESLFPDHYAQGFVQSGQMCAVKPAQWCSNIYAMGESQQLKLEAIEALISARNVNDLSIQEIMKDILDDEALLNKSEIGHQFAELA